MTSNQLAYTRIIEETRANKAREEQTRRSNELKEEENRIKWGQLSQTEKYNALQAALERIKADETARHNQAVEAESERHSRAQEDVSVGSLSETARHNEATESNEQRRTDISYAAQSETTRHNRETESAALATLRQKAADLEVQWNHMDTQDKQGWVRTIADALETLFDIPVKIGKWKK